MDKLKLINKLKLKKYRDEFGLFVIEGDKLINDCPDNFLEFVIKREDIGDKKFDKLSSLTTPQSAIAVCRKKEPQPISSKFIIALDRIQDPANVGAILRTAAAANLSDVILLNGTADVFNIKSVRASMGAIFHLNLIEMSEDEFLNLNFSFVSAHMKGTPYRQFVKSDNMALILGNEGSGISKNILERSEKITIPIHNVESLNVNAAAAVLIMHFT